MNILIQISKYLFVVLILLYCLGAYTYFRKKTPEKKKALLKRQVFIIYLMLMLGYTIIFLSTMNYMVLILLGGIMVYYAVMLMCYRLVYPKVSMLMVNDMMMLLSIGFIIIARLDLDEAVKQFMIAAGGTVIAFIIPVLVRKLKILPKLTWLYAVVGIASLMGVLALAAVSGGAKLSISVGGFTIQFSELVKITLVFFMASMLAKSTSFKSVLITTIIAGLHVIILVLSTDLGTALVFFVTYLVLVFVATRKPLYTLAGLGAGVLAAIASYFLFAHVRKRIVAWQDPFKVYDSSGYQIVQALFAIGAGGWFGAGLCQGRPNTIPVASKDFVFAAICEEFGSVFAICLILVCMSLFLLIVNISFEIHDTFYKLVALGLGTEYAFQVFLTIGGVTKFIPMTGITLPLVSYGGSSVMSTIIMLAIVQGLYILREDEGAELEKAGQQ